MADPPDTGPSPAMDRAILRALIDARDEALIAYDTDLRVTEWTAATARNTGITRARALGRSVLDLFPYIRDTAIEEEYRRSLAGETVDGREREWTASGSGDARYFDVTYSPLRDDAGTIVGGVVTTADVTSRRELDDQLASERRLLRTILDSAPQSVLAVDTELRIMEWNACSERNSGLRRAEVLGRKLIDVVPDLAGTEIEGDFRSAVAGALRHVRDRWYQARNGEPRCYDVVFAPMHDGRGAVTGAIMSAQDVTDRARAEAELARERAVLRTILGSAPIGVVAFDAEGRITEWNRAAEIVTGVLRQVALGRVATDLGPSDVDQVASSDRIARVLRGEPVRSEPASFTREGDTEPTHVEASVAPLRDTSNQVIGGVAVVVDVSERVRAESERDRLIADLDAARDRAERASQAKSAMLAGLSHELRTPLGAVLGFAQLLRDGRAGALTAAQLEYVDDVLTGAGYLLHVVNDALDLARIEAGVVEMRPERIDLEEVVRQAVATVAPLAAARSITLDAKLPAEGLTLIADAGRVRQVLLNYLSNAVKYSHVGSDVTVEAAAEGDAVRLTVRDTGPGIAADDMGRLFVEFQRLGADRDVPGSGLGLAITKRLVEAMGGTVSAESGVGGGSAFHAVLPLEPRR